MRGDFLTTRYVKTDKVTTVALEDHFWDALTEIAKWERTSLGEIVRQIDEEREPADENCLPRSRAGALRVFVLEYYRKVAASLLLGKGIVPVVRWDNGPAARVGEQSGRPSE
jgi:predicted DNA-binding ribbon-helix-helix protein